MNTKDVETGVPVMRELVKEKSVTMEYFLESSHLDAATADMLRKYDRDGNGSFSKDEVVAIILDLREAMQSNEMLAGSNKFFKRMLCGVSTFAFLLLTSMFGLSYAVAALTAKLDVNTNGVMTTSDGKFVVATDSTGYKIVPVKNQDTGAFCMSSSQARDLLEQATSGRTNVLVELDGVNGTKTVVEQVSGGVVTVEGAKTCFTNAQGHEVCMEPSADCVTPVNRRGRGLRVLDEEMECTQANIDAAIASINAPYAQFGIDYAQAVYGMALSGCENDNSNTADVLECKCDVLSGDNTIKFG